MRRAELEAAVRGELGSAQEARWLLEEVLRPATPADAEVCEAAERRIGRLVARCRAGEPFQYVLGHWAFRRLDLLVDPRVLIPRPETEQVVGVALGVLAPLEWRPDGPVAVDLGTGSGAIALSLALEAAPGRPDVVVWATDAEGAALAVAEANRRRVAARWPRVGGRVRFAEGHWWDALPADLAGRVDLAVANPPYVAEAEWPALEQRVRAEPRSALVAGPGRDGTPGLADVERVLDGAARWLARPGTAVVEIAPHQSAAAVTAARAAGADRVTVQPDLAGRDRALVAAWR